MFIARNALLLVAGNLSSPLNGVVAELLGPIGDPVKLILGLFQRAIAAIYAQGISEIESAIALDIERRHAAGFLGSEIQTGNTRLGCRIGAHSKRFDADPVAEGSKAKLADQCGAESVGDTERQALIAVERLAGEIEEGGTARHYSIGRWRFDGEIRKRVAREEIGLLRYVVVHPDVGLIDIEDLRGGSDVVVEDRHREPRYWAWEDKT